MTNVSKLPIPPVERDGDFNFGLRLTSLLADLDAAGEPIAAAHVQAALDTLDQLTRSKPEL